MVTGVGAQEAFTAKDRVVKLKHMATKHVQTTVNSVKQNSCFGKCYKAVLRLNYTILYSYIHCNMIIAKSMVKINLFTLLFFLPFGYFLYVITQRLT